MKKILCLLFVMVFVVFAASCADFGRSGKNDFKTEAALVVESAMNELCYMNPDGMIQYFHDGDVSVLPFENRTDLYDLAMQQLTNSGAASGYESLFRPLLNAVVDGVIERSEFVISDSTGDDTNGYCFTVRFSSVDLKNVADFDSLIQRSDYESYMEEIVKDIYESGKIKSKMSDQERMDAILPSMVDAMTEVVIGELEAADTVETQLEFAVTEKNGKWLIDTGLSDFGGLYELFG